ncbi:MAG: protein-disulfide reductase DsbD family protein [Candidatus Neomarinimicrobiota bacterium]
MKYIIKYLLLFALGFTQSSENPVTIKASPDNLTARAGEVVDVELDVMMNDEWHIYSVYKVSEGPLPTEISIGGEIVGSVAPLIEPKPINKFDPGFETITYYHEGNTKFKVPFKIKRNAKPGEYKISVDIFYMVCNIRLCYPPVTKTDSISITIEEGDIREGKSSFLISTLSNEDGGKSNNDSDSLLGVFLLAIGGAILSWVMPCVYPMIPIIISFFGKMSQEKHIGRNTIATFYGLGISGTFIFIGLLVGFLSWGVSDVAALSRNANIGNFIATNPWINLFLGVLFIFFALWMFGIININVAGALSNKTDQAGQSAKSAYTGSFLLGVTFAITSFSCTVPVVGSLLVIAATGTAGGLLTSLYGMTVYGLVFAAPFVALSLFPTALEKLPKSGAWMETLKIVFGFVEIAAAIKFLWVPDLEWGIGLLPRQVVLALFILISLIQLAYLLGLFKVGTAHNIKPFKVGKGRIVGIILTLSFLFPVAMSLNSKPTYHYSNMPRLMDELIEALVPPPPTEDAIAIKEGWFVDKYDEALEKAKLEGKPLFLDFTGVYCANCRVMERRVFPTKSVKKELDKMILARLYVDKKDSLSEVYARLQFERYNQATQPYYVVLDPSDESTLADTGGYIPKGFDQFLIKGIESFKQKSK